MEPPLYESRLKNWIGHGPIDHFKSERRVTNLCIVVAYVNHMQTILFKYQLSESKAGIKVAGRNSKTLRYIDGNTKPNRK